MIISRSIHRPKYTMRAIRTCQHIRWFQSQCNSRHLCQSSQGSPPPQLICFLSREYLWKLKQVLHLSASGRWSHSRLQIVDLRRSSSLYTTLKIENRLTINMNIIIADIRVAKIFCYSMRVKYFELLLYLSIRFRISMTKELSSFYVEIQARPVLTPIIIVDG